MPDPRSTRTPFSLRLIRWLCQEELAEEIEGNLIEYRQQIAGADQRYSDFRYWFQVANYLRPSTLKRFKYLNQGIMFKFNPLLTIRSLFKQGASSVINILGFSLGLVCVLFLYFHIQSELSFDSLHTDKDKIYRAVRTAMNGENNQFVGVTSGPYAPALQTDFPNSIQSTCRVQPADVLVTFGEKRFFEENIVMADSNFFAFFSIPLEIGTSDQVLNGLTEVVLSKETAKKYFGDANPIGEIIRLDNSEDFIVAGVIGDLASKTHLGDFSMVLNINVYELSGWWNNGLITYLKIDTPEEAQYVDAQLDDFMRKHLGEDFKNFGIEIGLQLEAMNDIYFNNATTFDWALHGDMNTIYILGLVGLAILLIACFNYVNLSIAQSFRRAKEIAIRKVLGGHKSRLILQFLGESFTILFFATSVAVIFALVLNPFFNQYFDLNINFDWSDPNLVLFGVILMGGTLLTAGLYPALLLSSFNPLKVLKGNKMSSGKNVIVRKSLVIAQFLIAVFMIATTLLISQQMRFVQNKELGFDREAIMLLDINNNDIRNNLESFKAAFESDPNVQMITMVGGEPGGFHDVTSLNLEGKEANQRTNIGWGDEDYFETFGIEMLAGRTFGQNLESDEQQTAVINEKAMEMLGLTLDDVLEKRLTIPSWNLTPRIIGVSSNYNYSSLKSEMEPLIIINGLRYRRIVVKMNPENISDAIAGVSDAWDQFSPSYPMEYEFLDDSLAQLYEHETKQSKVFTAFATVSIFLACMGVFGLATYTARQRQKELGIRKVLGASAQQIIGLLSKEFVLLIVVACLVALPGAWYFMDQWLGSFAYRINMASSWPLFLMSGLTVGVIAFLTIGFKTYRAAVSNPTESIRYE